MLLVIVCEGKNTQILPKTADYRQKYYIVVHLLGEVKRYCMIFRTFAFELINKNDCPDKQYNAARIS